MMRAQICLMGSDRPRTSPGSMRLFGSMAALQRVFPREVFQLDHAVQPECGGTAALLLSRWRVARAAPSAAPSDAAAPGSNRRCARNPAPGGDARGVRCRPRGGGFRPRHRQGDGEKPCQLLAGDEYHTWLTNPPDPPVRPASRSEAIPPEHADAFRHAFRAPMLVSSDSIVY